MATPPPHVERFERTDASNGTSLLWLEATWHPDGLRIPESPVLLIKQGKTWVRISPLPDPEGIDDPHRTWRGAFAVPDRLLADPTGLVLECGESPELPFAAYDSRGGTARSETRDESPGASTGSALGGSGRAFGKMTIANALFSAMSFLSGPLLARALSPYGRGLLSSVLVPVNLASQVLGSALQPYATRSAAKGVDTRQLLGSLGILTVLLGLGALAVSVPLSSLLAGHRPFFRSYMVLGFSLHPSSCLAMSSRGSAGALRIGIV